MPVRPVLADRYLQVTAPHASRPNVFDLTLLGRLDLRDAAGKECRALLGRPKVMALLAYLAAARPGGFHRRDRIVAVFWPELDQARARNALRQAVHHLRGALGAEAIQARGDEELALRADIVSSDIAAFREHVAAGRTAAALELVSGELLPGFHLSDAPEFERWLDEERESLRRQVAESATLLRQAEEQAGTLVAAARWARRAMEAAPYDEECLRALLRVLDRGGDRAGAVREYDRFARVLDADLCVEPAPETTRLVEEIRTRLARHDDVDATDREDQAPPVPATPTVPAVPSPAPAPWTAVAIGGGIVAAAAMVVSPIREAIVRAVGYEGITFVAAACALVALVLTPGFGRRLPPIVGRWIAPVLTYGTLTTVLAVWGYAASSVLVMGLGFVTLVAGRGAPGWRSMLAGARRPTIQCALLVVTFLAEGRLTAEPIDPTTDGSTVAVVLSFEPSTTTQRDLALRLWQTYARTFANVFAGSRVVIHPQEFTAETFAEYTLQEAPEREIVRRLLTLYPPPDLVLTTTVRHDEAHAFVRIGTFVRRIQGEQLSGPLTAAIIRQGHVDDVWLHALGAATAFLSTLDQLSGMHEPPGATAGLPQRVLTMLADGLATQTVDLPPEAELDSILAAARARDTVAAVDVLSLLDRFSSAVEPPDDQGRRRNVLSKVFGQ